MSELNELPGGTGGKKKPKTKQNRNLKNSNGLERKVFRNQNMGFTLIYPDDHIAAKMFLEIKLTSTTEYESFVLKRLTMKTCKILY